MKDLESNEFIELFGLPASGKSHYIDNLNVENIVNVNEKYILNNNRIIRNIKKIYIFILFIIIDFKDFYKANKFLSKLTFHTKNKKIKMLVYLCNTIFMVNKIKYSKNNANKKYYFEEGMLQVLWGICYNNNNKCKEAIIDDFFDLYKNLFATKILYLNTNADLIKQRLINRNAAGGSELEHDIKENQEYLEKAIVIKNAIINKINELHLNLLEICEVN